MISYTEQKDQWYELFISRTTGERYEMYMDLLDQAPPDNELIKDDFGSIAVELKSNLIHEKKYEEVINLIEKTRKATKKFYQKEFPYLSDFAVEFYLYKEDTEKVRDHLQLFIDYPDVGYDLFIPLFNRICFYKKNDLALSIAKVLYEPIKDSSELISGAEIALVDTIFYNLFQNFYTSLEDGQEPDLWQLEDEIKKFNYDDDFFKTELPRMINVLKNISKNDKTPIITEWMAFFQDNRIHAYRDLFWHFAVYMHRKRNIHFSISQHIWFTFFNVLKKKDSFSDFSFQRQSLEEVVSDFIGFLSNKEEEGFAFIWGIPYIYEFLDDQQLVTNNIKEQSLQHVKALKDSLINAFHRDIWRFNFVHTWERPTTVPINDLTEETEIFSRSFIEPPKEMAASTQTVSNTYEQMSLFDDFFGESNRKHSKPKQMKADNKKKQKQAKKHRKKNRRK